MTAASLPGRVGSPDARNARSRPVVVGVSTWDSRLPVVRWAAEEAAACNAELRLVTACPARTPMDQYLPADPADAIRDNATIRLAGMVGYVRAGWPRLVVVTEVVAGAPAGALRAAAADADLLVVGADDASPFVEAISGSVPGDLLATSPCPLAVVPRAEWLTDPAAPVIVAVDEIAAAHAALAYGFEAAHRSGRSLSVVHCLPASTPDRLDRVEPVRVPIDLSELYPRVTVASEAVVGDPREALARHSRRAALLVLGSRGRGRLASTLFGSVSRHLIRRGACPVVVVPLTQEGEVR